ncbi:MAG: phosphoesterase [Afipia sp.]|nr:phosphoesterase [Afipia sp.]
MSSTSQIDTLFSGISNTSTYPPHNGLAVGPNNIVMAEGSRIEWTNLAGGAATTQSVYGFFSPLGAAATNSLFDPRCFYDSASGRYIIIMDNIGANGTISSIDIAVSKDSNPNDGWYFASLNTSLTINGQLTSSDRPSISIDNNNIYITAPQYNVNVSGYAGTETWVIGKTAGAGGGLYNGGTMTVVANQITPSSQGIFSVAAGNNGLSYYACDYSTGSQIVAVVQTYNAATSTFGPAITLALGNIDQGGTYTAQQQGTTALLDAGDKRIQSLQYANGFLWGVSEMKPIGSTVPLVHWFKIDVGNPAAPKLIAQGDISGASLGPNVSTFNGSIAVDGAGDVVINFTASGPNMYPSDYYVYQAASDPVGSFSSPVLYQASTGFFDSGNGSGVQRWGAYSTAIADPNNPNAVWISNEYVANGWWQTAVSQVEIKSTSTPAITSIAITGNGITGGSGILNTGKTATIAVTFSAAVTVNTSSGSPTLLLNDGGIATYIGTSGNAGLVFNYVVAPGQNTPELTISAFALNGATIRDSLGNAADLSGAANSNPAGILQIDTIAPPAPVNLSLDAATDSGTKGDGVTTFTQLQIDGSAEPASIVTLYDTNGTTVLGSGAANSVTGAFSITTSQLASGQHHITAKATDTAGNVSAVSTAYNVTVTASTGSTSEIETQFSGISDTSSYPPHNALAVGPNYTVTLEGSKIEWTSLTGGSATLQSVYQFFKPLGTTATNALFDPRAVYDSVNNRYVVIMDNIGANGAISNIDIAVSKDANPNDGWYFASLNTSLTINGVLTSSDTPVVSVDGSNIYITAPQYNASGGGWQGTAVWVIGDTVGAGGGIYNGGAMTVTASEITSPNQGIYRVVAGDNGNAYYASSYSTGGQIVVTLQVYNAASKTFGPISTIGLGNIDQGGSYTAQQLGTKLLLDATDKRVQNIAYANGFLYGVTEEKPNGSSVPLVHWFKIDVSNPNSPTLAAQGDISGAALGSNVATFNGSIAVNGAGDVIINFTASGPNMYPSDYYVYQSGSGGSGAFSDPVLYQSSSGFFNSGNGSSIQRWGINSTAIADPNNPNGFWISNEYVANGWWQTSVSEISIGPAAEAPTLTLGSSAITVNAGGSVPLPISVTATDADDTVSVTISGLTSYETVTDALDKTVFSGNSVTLTAAQINSGVSLQSTYGGTDHPVNTLTVTASNTTPDETAASAPQTIVVTDPPMAATAAADGHHPRGASFHHLSDLMTQYMASGFDGTGNHAFGPTAHLLPAANGAGDLPHLVASHHA